ncbi:hypothetical protein ANCDUO_24018 [Ancylostoma duodenale]|uniref:Uncharacterized protein n=1 Tax=Ancylostoma duodenale TaxID=51022 RepID=A0A0C2C8C2_9BILA|nr:hypothetical protein ANCDUO_24018 [Ancylostoma duodenale]
MRWHDVIAKAIASLFCLFVWRLSLRTLSRCVPTYAGEQKYFPKHLINDDHALNRYRLNISEQIYPRLRKQADHFSPLEIRIIASDRRQNYLAQVITFLVDAYQSHKQLSPSLEICNVEPEVFEELRKFKMHVPIRTLGRRSSRSSRMNETIAKEAADYWKCLNHTTKGRINTRNEDSSYIMLLEDDALVVPEFARLMTSLMDQLDRRQHIDYVKMYHPNQLRKIPSIPLVINFIIYEISSHFYQKFQAISICILVCCTYCIVIFRRVLLFWSLLTSSLMYLELRSYGSQFLADVRYYLTDTVYLSSPESCCTPAVLFRASKVPEILPQLSLETRRSARTGHAKDHILDESPFVGRQTDMNLVVHIGAMSSVRKRRITLNEVIAVQARND